MNIQIFKLLVQARIGIYTSGYSEIRAIFENQNMERYRWRAKISPVSQEDTVKYDILNQPQNQCQNINFHNAWNINTYFCSCNNQGTTWIVKSQNCR